METSFLEIQFAGPDALGYYRVKFAEWDTYEFERITADQFRSVEMTCELLGIKLTDID